MNDNNTKQNYIFLLNKTKQKTKLPIHVKRITWLRCCKTKNR